MVLEFIILQDVADVLYALAFLDLNK